MRNVRFGRGSLLLGVCALGFAFAAEARAGQTLVYAQTTFNSAGAKTVGVNFNGSSGTYYAAPFKTTVHRRSDDAVLYDSITTFCVDFLNRLNQSQMDAVLIELDASSPLVEGSTGGGTLQRNLGAAAYMMASVLGYDLTYPPSLTADQEAALQVAIWEVTYDWNSTGGYASTTSAKDQLKNKGLFKLTSVSNAILDTAAQYLVNAWDTSTNAFRTTSAMFLNYPPPGTIGSGSNQDQLFVVPGGGTGAVVPEPSTLAMGGIGLIFGLGAMLRRRRLARA